jgi:hypothetical protein
MAQLLLSACKSIRLAATPNSPGNDNGVHSRGFRHHRDGKIYGRKCRRILG